MIKYIYIFNLILNKSLKYCRFNNLEGCYNYIQDSNNNNSIIYPLNAINIQNDTVNIMPYGQPINNQWIPTLYVNNIN